MESTSLIYSCLWQRNIASGGLQPSGYGGVSYQVTNTNQNPALSLSADEIPYGTWPQHWEVLYFLLNAFILMKVLNPIYYFLGKSNYFTIDPIWKIGKYIEININPTISPIKIIKTGSKILLSCLVFFSIS